MKSLILLIAIICLALLTILVLSEHQPANGGVPIVKTAAPRRPVAWRRNSVCMIDEHKSTEQIV